MSATNLKSTCLLLSLAAMADSTMAGDFRVADIGGSCATIREQEIALGSLEIPGQVGIAFAGRAYGRDVEIRYLCAKDLLVTGTYFFTFAKVEDAFDAFEEIYGQLSSTYGVPVLDHDPWPSDPASKTRSRGLMLRTMTTWNNPRLRVTAAIAQRAESVGGGYLVSVIFGESLDAVREDKTLDANPTVPPDTALERTREG
jgi:hypothetical protein